MATIALSPFNSLPVVSFYNTATRTRVTWICRTSDVAEHEAARLRSMPHVTEVEITDAPVKGAAN
jgi:hypothetical protein